MTQPAGGWVELPALDGLMRVARVLDSWWEVEARNLVTACSDLPARGSCSRRMQLSIITISHQQVQSCTLDCVVCHVYSGLQHSMVVQIA